MKLPNWIHRINDILFPLLAYSLVIAGLIKTFMTGKLQTEMILLGIGFHIAYWTAMTASWLGYLNRRFDKYMELIKHAHTFIARESDGTNPKIGVINLSHKKKKKK